MLRLGKLAITGTWFLSMAMALIYTFFAVTERLIDGCEGAHVLHLRLTAVENFVTFFMMDHLLNVLEKDKA